MMEDGLGGDLGSPFLSEGRVAPLSVALSVILHRVSQMRDGDLSEREFDARLFDSFSSVDEDSHESSISDWRDEDKIRI